MAELNDKLITYGNLSTFHDNLINDSVTSGNSTWSSEKIASEIQQGGGGGGSTTIENVTYAQLKAKRDNSQLVKGQQYRITDYVTTAQVDDDNIHSAEHPFDLIVTAIDVNKLSETGVKAAHCANDDYFTQSGETMYRWKGWDYGGDGDAYLYTEDRYFPNVSAGTCEIDASDFYEQEYYTTGYTIAGIEYVDSEYGDLYVNPNKVILYIDENNHLIFGDSPYEYYLDKYNQETEAGEPHELTLEEVEWFNGKYFVDNGDSANMEMSFDRQVELGAVNAKLNAWEIKYSLDNDKTRFNWAQAANQGLGFSAIQVKGSKGLHYYIDNGLWYTYEYVGTITDSEITYYKWYSDDEERTVLTEQATYANTPSGVDSDGCTYYNEVYDIVGEIVIDGETFDSFYKGNKHIIKTETITESGETRTILILGDTINCNGDETANNAKVGTFLYKRYASGDTQDSYAWIGVVDSLNLSINNKMVNWDNVDINDIIYTSSLTPSIGSTVDKFEVIEYNSNVQFNVEGKGTIYYLKDEYNNIAEYDFKNLLYNSPFFAIQYSIDGDLFLGKRYPQEDTNGMYAYVSLNGGVSTEDTIFEYSNWDNINTNYIWYFVNEYPSIGEHAYTKNGEYVNYLTVINNSWISDKFKFTFGIKSENPKDNSLIGNSNNNDIKTILSGGVRYIPILNLRDNIKNYTNIPKNIWSGTLSEYNNLSVKYDEVLYLIYE